ncbi:hypothetical protein O3P69_000707 [Scylla paramamosain]|uniref:NACHT domain-containing protein n=1 Tax=Scylla paramamosain TaxID=85552 RepID=A0AAW0URT9_SCYPA
MSTFRNIITPQDITILKLFKITKTEFREALHLVFKWGCKKKDDESIKDYLTNKERGKSMTMTVFRNMFDKEMRKRIEEDHTGVTYDVSLLFACIKWGCDDLKWGEKPAGNDTVESLCTTAKNLRNKLAHDPFDKCDVKAMDDLCDQFKKIPEKLLTLAKDKYKPAHDVDQEIKKINEHMDNIMKTTIGDPYDLQKQLLKLRKEQVNTINEQGKSELSKLYEDISKIDPASFVTGKERLNIKNVFTKLDVSCANEKEIYDLEYNELLEVKTESGGEPSVIILEGDAGAGKTTLTKLILSDWVGEKSIFRGLRDYDLVLHAEGKKQSISSYLGLIQYLIPTASYKFDDDDLIRSVLKLKVLLVMDGFDELNEGSEKLIRELSEKHIQKSSGKLHLLITTRPSKHSDLLHIVNHHPKVQTKLRGIPFDKRIEFVEKLHNEMISEKQSNQETSKLIDFMKHSRSQLGEHYRLPLNLTLLTYLWAADPGKINPKTTATGLYIAFHELIQSRLLKRLQDCKGVVALPKDKCEEGIREFLQEYYSVCLDTLSSGSMQLSDLSTKALDSKCTELKLPFNDMSEAFLVVDKVWTSKGFTSYLTVHHKSILEFYAANRFMTYINKENDASSDKAKIMYLLKKLTVPEEERKEIFNIINKYSDEDTKSLKRLCQKLLKTHEDLTKYDNMFLYLTGLLTHQGSEKLQEYSAELVEEMKVAGFQGTRWLDFLVEAECNEELASLLARFFSGSLEVCDGHTRAALVLFKYLDISTPVRIILENEVSYIPYLDDMLVSLSKRNCEVELSFQHQWRYKESGFSDYHLNSLLGGKDENQKCNVSRFTGNLMTLSHLPKSVKNLCITFGTTEQAQQILKELPELVKRNHIRRLGIHVMPDVQPDSLSELSILNAKSIKYATLLLSKIESDWMRACKVIRALLPVNGTLSSLKFPQSNISAAQFKSLIIKLGEMNVVMPKIGGVHISFSVIEKLQLIGLKTLTRDTLNCELHCVDESVIWKHH